MRPGAWVCEARSQASWGCCVDRTKSGRNSPLLPTWAVLASVASTAVPPGEGLEIPQLSGAADGSRESRARE